MPDPLSNVDLPSSPGLVLAGEPDVHVHTNALFVPKRWNFDPSVGIFTEVGYLIPQTALFHKNPPEMKGHCCITDLDLSLRYDTWAEAIYVGHLDLHYGHTLTEFIPRLWALRKHRLGGEKLLFHSSQPTEKVFLCPWLLELLSLCGLAPDDFITFDTPTRIGKLTVPSPAFGEDNYVYRIFGEYCATIGDQARSRLASSLPEGPIWFSRSRLTKGTWSVENETELCNELVAKGFSVVFPETLSVAEQIASFGEQTIVAGPIGSAFHNAVFSRGAASLCLTSGTPSRNFLLMDTVSDISARYVTFPYRPAPARPEFNSTIAFKNPKALATAITEVCSRRWDAIRTVSARRKEIAERYETARRSKLLDYDCRQALQSPILLPSPLELISLTDPAHRLSTTQSSVCEWSAGTTPEEDSAHAVNGKCTGHFAFHTAYESEPWWQITFRQPFHVCLIRLYNRLDNAGARGRAVPLSIDIQTSDDGDWKSVFTYENSPVFGGAEGHPLEWSPREPVLASAVRIRLLKKECLHLDQVQIFGLPI